MLTLQFIPYHEIEDLSSEDRINKILDIAKQNSIVLIEGRLSKGEEKDLISQTMSQIDDDFKGIELAVIYPTNKNLTFGKKLKIGIVELLMRDRQGLTIIGPATIVKEIKKDPDKIQLLTGDAPLLKKKKRRRK